MKKNKTENGITLVALIITIIVLLILAVVAIGVVTGDGILFHAKDASTKYAEKADEENSTLQDYSDMIVTQALGVPIPKGFKYIEGTKEEGVVIEREDKDDNSQFVWVPVTKDIQEYGLDTTNYREPDVVTGVAPSEEVNSASGSEYDAVKENLEEAGCKTDLTGDGKVNAYDFKQQLTNEFNSMAASVKKYGGFYVGRYETSFNSKTGKAQSIKGVESAYNKEGVSSPGFWYTLYGKQREYSTESVQGSMIWGNQWNAMMSWIGDAANTTIEKPNQTRITGTAPDDVIKKVYDLYGNSYEWTLEAYRDKWRMSRGGVTGNGNYPSYYSSNTPISTVSSRGSRLALYIK